MEKFERNKRLKDEMQHMFTLNVKQQFELKPFQDVTKKLISDKKTLTFSPGALNKKL